MLGKLQRGNRRLLCKRMKVTALGLTTSREFLEGAACVLATVSASLTDSGGTA